MADIADYNPSISENKEARLDPEKDSFVEEAATLFAELFLQQYLYEKRREEGRATSEDE